MFGERKVNAAAPFLFFHWECVVLGIKFLLPLGITLPPLWDEDSLAVAAFFMVFLIFALIIGISGELEKKARKKEVDEQNEEYPKQKAEYHQPEERLFNMYDQGYKEPELKCPRCGSTYITANKKGFGVGKAIGGAILTGGIGLLAGFIGSGKVKITCLKCGRSWKP